MTDPINEKRARHFEVPLPYLLDVLLAEFERQGIVVRGCESRTFDIQPKTNLALVTLIYPMAPGEPDIKPKA